MPLTLQMRGEIQGRMGQAGAQRRVRSASIVIACDFCVVASATFRILYVLVVMELFDRSSRVVARPVLNGLHHEYDLLARAA